MSQTPAKQRLNPAAISPQELGRRLRASNTARQFGFVLKSASSARVVLSMRVQPRHKQVRGVVHGGVLAALADTAGGLAAYMCASPGARVATVEMKINYLEPVEKGTVIAEATVLRRGQHLAVVDCALRVRGRLAATALLTLFIAPPQSGVLRGA